ASPGLVGRDLVKEVSGDQTYVWPKLTVNGEQLTEKRFKVVVIDCGVKLNILRELQKNNCRVIVVPARTTAEEILMLHPNGILLSNGPGDPAGVPYVVETVRKLINQSPVANHQLPIMGICLGHQILGLALGGKTYKLKFGHRGGNQPVKDLSTGKVSITSQNHGFCVDIRSLKDKEVEVTHINLNDHTLEGMRHKRYPIFSVQYHPEASPGPHDAKYLFSEFIDLMRVED
ncbi:glutamine-hydrolyzing carbamoyl-phosphate synthase small subunit, partial [candidate division NPL-UPA2 bacterium]|nr:glutamine-hydrolyzing carbamoyl-phosphate synthase small subunit [candidate division NPL-UPA2 bacterium]